MAASTIKTASRLCRGVKVAFIGCLDNTLRTGHGLITRNGTHYFGTLMSSQHDWTPLVGYSEDALPVAIGHGHFGIGNLIYRYGTSEPVCMASMPIISGSNGARITRVFENDNVLEISCISLRQPGQPSLAHEFKFVHSLMEAGLLVVQQDCICRLDEVLKYNDIHYFKGYLIVQEDYETYRLINCCCGAVTDTMRSAGYSRQLRPIDGGRLMGMYVWTAGYDELMDEYFGDEPDVFTEFCRTLDVQDGKFVVWYVEYASILMNKMIRDIFGLHKQAQFGWHDNLYATDTIMVVNFRIKCCLDNANLVPAHPKCDLLSTAHRDTYGLIHLPTGTVIKLRARPIFAGNLNNTPVVVETLLSRDVSTLAVVVKSTEAIRTPTWNYQVVVIDTATGMNEIAYCGSTGSTYMDGATPKLLYIEDDTAVVFQVFDTAIRQPFFNARVDAVADRLYDLFDCRLPMEITLKIAGYLG